MPSGYKRYKEPKPERDKNDRAAILHIVDRGVKMIKN